MKRRVAFAIALMLGLCGTLYSEEPQNQGSVVHLSLNLVDAMFGNYTNLEDEGTMVTMLASGLSADFNPFPRYFFRIEGSYNYDLGIEGSMTGAEIGAGIGYAFKKAYYERAPYTNVFVKDTPIGGGWIERETTIETGTCRALKTQILEAGFIKLFMHRWEYEFFYYGNEEDKSEDIGDLIFYAGYRMANYYKQSVSRQAIIFYAHALLGFKDRDIESEIYEDGYSDHYFLTDSDKGLALGAEVGVDAYITFFRLRYYAGEVAFHAGFRIPLSFVRP